MTNLSTFQRQRKEKNYLLKLKKWLNLLKNVFNFIEKLFSLYLVGFVILSMMIFVTYEVLTRKFFSISTPAIVDLVSLAMLIIVFCSLSGIQRREEHLRIDFLVAKLKGTKLFLSRLFEQIISLASCLFFTYASFRVLMYTIKFNSLSEGALIPKWYFFIFVPISLILLCIRIVFQIGDTFSSNLTTTNYGETNRK